MAGVTEQDEVELLRAIAHARMYITSGRGLESVVHTLANGNLGKISEMLAPTLDRMAEGEPAESALRVQLDRVDDAHLRSFLSALIASGKPGMVRLDELSQALHAERESKAEIYGARLTGIVDITATLFVFSFAPTIVRVLGRVPPNSLLPSIDPGPWFELVFYSLLASVLTALLWASRVK